MCEFFLTKNPAHENFVRTQKVMAKTASTRRLDPIIHCRKLFKIIFLLAMGEEKRCIVSSIRSSDTNFGSELGRVLEDVKPNSGYLRVNRSGEDLVVTFIPKATTFGGKIVQYVRRLFDSSFNINQGVSALLSKIQSFSEPDKRAALNPLLAISERVNNSRIFRKIDVTQIRSAMPVAIVSALPSVHAEPLPAAVKEPSLVTPAKTPSTEDMTEAELIQVIDHLASGLPPASLTPRLQSFVLLAQDILKCHVSPKDIKYRYPYVYANDVAMNILARMNPLSFAHFNCDDRRAVLFAVRYSPHALRESSFRGDREVVLEAVTHCGLALQYAYAGCKVDKEINIAAFKNNLSVANDIEQRVYLLDGCSTDVHKLVALYLQDEIPDEFAAYREQVEAMRGLVDRRETLSESMYNNDTVMQALAVLEPKILMQRYPGDKKAALFAVRYHPKSLRDCENAFKKDRDVVLEAVRCDGRALEYAHLDLQNDREIVLAALQNYSWAESHIGAALREDQAALNKEAWMRNLRGDSLGSPVAAPVPSHPLPRPAASGGGSGSGGAAAGRPAAPPPRSI